MNIKYILIRIIQIYKYNKFINIKEIKLYIFYKNS